MKKNFVLFLLLLTSLTTLAQKIDQRLTGLVRQNNARRAQGLTVNPKKTTYDIAAKYDQDGSIRFVGVQAYLKQGAECPTQQLEQMGIEVRFTVDNVAVLSVPVDKLADLENVDEIAFVKADALMQKNNDVSRQDTKAVQITESSNATAAGLPQAYTGKGVLLGIIDGGIDFNHAAFKDFNGNTRIKKVVIFANDLGKYTEYTTAEQIAALTTDKKDTHGTHTSATAAGSEVGNGLQGVAPEADIMMVAMGATESESNMALGMQLIADYAKQLGKPCVISMSQGILDDLHDGSSVVCKKVKELTESGTKAGIAVCISAGNEGDSQGSIVKTLGDGDANGWQLKTLMGYGKSELFSLPLYLKPKIIIYAKDGSDFTAELRLVNIETGAVTDVAGKFVTNDAFNIDKIPDIPTSIILKKTSNYPNAKGGTSVVYRTFYDEDNSFLKPGLEKYRLAVFIKGTKGQEIRMVTGAGRQANEPLFMMPTSADVIAADKTYVSGSSTLSCNSDICDDAVISVGSYVSRTSWSYYNQGRLPNANLGNSVLTHKPIELGAISDFSSYADADDNGIPRPTVLGPGQKTCSAYSIYDFSYFKEDGTIEDEDLDFETGKKTKKPIDALAPIDMQILDRYGRNHYYGYMEGTSMSTPHVAGVLALWMQADPTLTVNKIKDIMSKTCRKDAYVTDVTKIATKSIAQAGYGKIDALAGLKMIKGADDIEAISIGGHREATPATMYSVDAPVYNLQGQRVDKSHKGLVIYKGRVYMNK